MIGKTHSGAILSRGTDPAAVRRGGRHGPLSVRVYRHIDEVDPAEWDAFLHPDDLQVTHRFVKTCQDAGVEGADFRHVIIDDGDGPACVATLSRMHVAPDLLSPWGPRTILRRLRRRRRNLLRPPFLFCGLPVSFGNPCLRLRPGVEPGPILRALSGVMESVAREVRADFICFKEFTAEEAEAMEPLEHLGYFRAHSMPGCVLPIRWRTFDEYLGAMRAGYRRQLAKSLHVRERDGLEIRILEEFEGECEAIFGLYEQVMDRAEFQLERLNLDFFRLLDRRMGPASRALLVEQGGVRLAAGVLLRTPRCLTFLLAGIDYDRNREHHAYLNLVAEVVAEAIRAGVDRLEMGQTSYGLKQRLGGQTTPRFFFLRHRGAWTHHTLRRLSPVIFPLRTYPPRRCFRSS